MSLVSINVPDLIQLNWITNNDRTGSLNPYFKPKTENTYMIVFGPHQNLQLNFFRSIKDRFNILYEAPKALNKRYPGSGPRNTLFIFETKDEPITL